MYSSPNIVAPDDIVFPAKKSTSGRKVNFPAIFVEVAPKPVAPGDFSVFYICGPSYFGKHT